MRIIYLSIFTAFVVSSDAGILREIKDSIDTRREGNLGCCDLYKTLDTYISYLEPRYRQILEILRDALPPGALHRLIEPLENISKLDSSLKSFFEPLDKISKFKVDIPDRVSVDFDEYAVFKLINQSFPAFHNYFMGSKLDLDVCHTSIHDNITRCRQWEKHSGRHKRSWYNPVDWIGDALKDVFQTLLHAVEFLFEPFLKVIVKFVGAIVKEVWTAVKEIYKEVSPSLDDVFHYFEDAFEELVGYILRLLVKLVKYLFNLLIKLVSTFPEIVFDYVITIFIFYIITKKFFLSALVSLVIFIKLT
uniref:Uncharacterized protein n=1 Tax=Saiwaicho virus TaxID=2170594 RepID=A0A2S0S4Q3_9VIRU|nr:hypothetical protein [Saiwaicho virus]